MREGVKTWARRGGIAVGVVGGLGVAGYLGWTLLQTPSGPQRQVVNTVTRISLPPPPPPPPPPKVDPPPPQPARIQEAPRPTDRPPPPTPIPRPQQPAGPPALGLAPGPGGANPYGIGQGGDGLVVGGTGGGGSGESISDFNRRAVRLVAQALQNNPDTRNSRFRGRLLINVDGGGRVQEVRAVARLEPEELRRFRAALQGLQVGTPPTGQRQQNWINVEVILA